MTAAIGHRHVPGRGRQRVVIHGAVWRRLLVEGARVVRITLPVVNFGRARQIKPTVTVMLKREPTRLAGTTAREWERAKPSTPGSPGQ